MAINDRFGLGLRNAIAANKAHELNEERKDLKNAQNGEYQGTLEKIVDNVGDTMADALNVATLGGFRKFTNMFDDKDSKIDYDNLKQGSKSKVITADSTTDARAKLLTNQAVFDADLKTNNDRIKELKEKQKAAKRAKKAKQDLPVTEEPSVQEEVEETQEV